MRSRLRIAAGAMLVALLVAAPAAASALTVRTELSPDERAAGLWYADRMKFDQIREQGLTGKAWLATKLSGVTGREAGLAQFSDTLRRLGTDKVALLQVHNLGDLKTQMAVARELKGRGKVKYVGVTHYVERAQEQLADVVQAEKPDFLQINYSVVSRGAEKRVLPLACGSSRVYRATWPGINRGRLKRRSSFRGWSAGSLACSSARQRAALNMPCAMARG